MKGLKYFETPTWFCIMPMLGWEAVAMGGPGICVGIPAGCCIYLNLYNRKWLISWLATIYNWASRYLKWRWTVDKREIYNYSGQKTLYGAVKEKENSQHGRQFIFLSWTFQYHNISHKTIFFNMHQEMDSCLENIKLSKPRFIFSKRLPILGSYFWSRTQRVTLS